MRGRLVAAALVSAVTASGEARAQDAHGGGAPPAPSPVGEGSLPARLTRAPRLVSPFAAEYPEGEQSSPTVVLVLTIGKDGNVQDTRILASGGARFDGAAAAAARRLLFTPAEIDGRPVAVKIKYAFAFKGPPPPSPPVGDGAAAPAAPAAPQPGAPAPSASPAPPPAPPAPPPVQDVFVHGKRRRPDEVAVTVTATEAGKVAGTQGDPIKIVESLPGLGRASFGSGQLIVWGSAPTETRTYVDGVPIPTLFHGSALRSTVNGALVKDVTLVPGAYGPEHGLGLGGMVSVETRDLPATGVHGYVGVDTLDESAMATAALGDRVRVAVAGRLGWLDGVLRAVDAPSVDQYFAIPRYSDYQAKVQVDLRPGESLDAVFLGSRDDLTQTVPDADPAHARSQTTGTGYERGYLHYHRRLGAGERVDVVPWLGHDRSDLRASFGANPASLSDSTFRWGLRASHHSRVAGPLTLTLGLDVDGTSSQLARSGSLTTPAREGDVTVFGRPPGDDSNVDSWGAGVLDVAPYVVADLVFGALRVSPGLRVDAMLLDTSRRTPRIGDTPPIGFAQLVGEVEPRIAAHLRVAPRLGLLAAAGLYSQPPAPSDLSAVFGTPTLGAASASHVTAGTSLLLGEGLTLDTVGYYKWLTDLAVRDPSPTPKLAEALVPSGVGRAYGVQFLLRQQPWNGLSGWAACTLSRSERRDTPDGAFRLFDYDQPLVLTLVGSKELGPWTFGARFRYARGLPRTPVVGTFYDLKDDASQPLFGPQNSMRLPDFWQLDLRVDRSFPLGGSRRLLVYLEGLNVTNRANGEEYTYNATYTRRGTVTGLPIVGVLGIRVDL